MWTRHRYPFWMTLRWSRNDLLLPTAWAAGVTALHEFADFSWLALPWLPMSAVAVAVAFYIGFKNNASYDRTWEARKIWGAIVNASRSLSYGIRDLVGAHGDAPAPASDLASSLVPRHVAWLNALRFQLRKLQSWEHGHDREMKLREHLGVPEYREDLKQVLSELLPAAEVEAALARANPATWLLGEQSRALAELRRAGQLDGFSHVHLQGLIDSLMAEQGKAERIKNFPFPRQYATVNWFFVVIFVLLLPLGLLEEFTKLGELSAWATVPFTGLVGWVFLSANRIGEWSENPFEGLHNDVPISAMARGIERDVRELAGQTELPRPRQPNNNLLF